MTENFIELRSVFEILGMNFFVPGYQRGYRWTEQQVRDLLNDVDEFNPEKAKDSHGETWYCLQPLVVKLMEKSDPRLADEDGCCNWYEVFDGQHRLTTIFLIVSYFNERWIGKEKQKLPNIKYETRKDSYDYLKELEIGDDNKAHIKNNNFFQDYIDYYYMQQAYNEIHSWAQKKSGSNSFFDRNKFQSKLIYNTRFIWYESVDEDPIKVFTRLNIGKISLTNAELIKALLLNSSNFVGNDEYGIRLRQQEIASEWDNIEYTLQNDEFWLFLHEKGYDRPTRIDFIFDLMCGNNSLELSEGQVEAIGEDDYRTFRYFYEYFKSGIGDVSECWKKVKKYFCTFKEWFDDLELYHYVGYLIENLDALSKNDRYNLSELIRIWDDEQTEKRMFVAKLKSKIREIINSCPPLDYQYKNDGSDKGKCKPILLFHNIQTVINQNYNQLRNEKYLSGVFYKFPFHLYKKEGWDVEHINSNTTNLEDDQETQEEWLMNVYLSADDLTREKIVKYFEVKNRDERTALFDEIRKRFPQHDNWSQEEKNRIWNYTLLDSSTNRSYGNSIFSGKRRVIIGKDKGVLIPVPKPTRDGRLEFTKEKEADSSFVPPCTKQVFMKFFSVSSGDNNYWTKEFDAPAYLQDIKDCLSKLED